MNPCFEALRDDLERALSGLDEGQTQLRPASRPEKWNIQQIVGHLTLTYEMTIVAMDARLAKGAATKAKPSLVQRAAQFTLCGMGYFPRGRIAPERVTARPDATALPGDMLFARVEAAIAEMDRKVMAGERLFGHKRRAISHMVLGPMSVDQWRRFHLIHGRHHIKQIAGIRAEYGI